ncbi:hypothetical protein CLAFUW4_10655 [Fulvia fulva]|uniref:Uncharacterized protein n=1 Tax=Passalora fulva TaxID=5499 RepID=A0A9Q8P7N5_PASFU|nr:uncharacterized protein CLAFUR5_05267 [Fulvia fulva]KAK4616143.1 hypothetical protein CLAFUR4_10660 [Fulvia fulva]KAK4616394.1 hypothetical protein CLAFUR0_10584 [Fulvia fulva]UJO16213.1 hypothetical protein CLAFUR5_05267 [Fulvia fulva]WPV18866.1 hypothetical protein CLAFUW4_10655 [Fulvia fulva]WPV34466.1 hypothetical protein CLAFUW7_10657 [Fulvia fulva]
MAVKRKTSSQGRRMMFQGDEDTMTEKSPFFMSIEVKHEEIDHQNENVAPTIEVDAPIVAPTGLSRIALSPRSPNAGARQTRLPVKSAPPRANTISSISQFAEKSPNDNAPPARPRGLSKSTPTPTSAIDMALHIFAAFPLDHELYIGAERTFVKERVNVMLESFQSGYETQALWVAARLRERQVARDHIEKVIERLMEVEATEMADWLQSKVKDVLLLRSVCEKVLAAPDKAES